MKFIKESLKVHSQWQCKYNYKYKTQSSKYTIRSTRAFNRMHQMQCAQFTMVGFYFKQSICAKIGPIQNLKYDFQKQVESNNGHYTIS